MYTETDGVILKQTKTVNGRRMIVLFSKKFGKINAGTSINEKGKGKSALAMRPFTYGRYELFKNRDSYHINNAEVQKSYYKIGEDVEKYMCCSYILEFTERLLWEEASVPKVFTLLIDFFDLMERRKKAYLSLVLAYQIKALQFCGCMPQVKECVICGAKEEFVAFSVKDGGIVCKECIQNIPINPSESLIYSTNIGIINVLEYILGNPLKSFENLALTNEVQKPLANMIKDYLAYHLDIGNLKSQGFLIE